MATTTTAPETVERSYTNCPPIALAVMTDRVERLAKAARRLGFPEPTITDVNTYMVEGMYEGSLPEARVDFVVRGVVPRLEGGWSIIGSVEHIEGVNVVHVVDPSIDPETYRDLAPTCDHCSTKRARSMTVLVKDEAGDVKRVGKSCLRDFVGHDVPNWYGEGLYDEINDNEIDRLGDSRGWPAIAQAFVAAAWAIDTYGYVKATDEGTATKVMMGHYGGPRVMAQHPVTRDMVNKATDALNYWRQMEAKSTFDHNVKALVTIGVVNPTRHYGLIAGAMIGWINQIKRDLERATIAANRPDPTPVIEGRIVITGVVTKTDTKHGDYGTRQVMTIVDDRGFSVWGSNPINAKTGDRVTFTATVSKSDRDETFGFYKRPGNASVVGQ